MLLVTAVKTYSKATAFYRNLDSLKGGWGWCEHSHKWVSGFKNLRKNINGLPATMYSYQGRWQQEGFTPPLPEEKTP